MKPQGETPKIGGPEPVLPGRVRLSDEARKARARLLPTTITFLTFSAAVILAAFREGPANVVVGFTVVGVLSFSLVEYCVHRFILHGRFPEGRGLRHLLHKSFDHLHIQHHARPWDSNHNGGTLNDTLIPILGVFFGFAVTTPFAAGPVFWAAVVASYVAEEWIHHAIHYCSFKHPAFLALRRHHTMHHAAPGTESNYGLSSPLWDVILGTRFRAASLARGGRSRHSSKFAVLVIVSILLAAAAPAWPAEVRCLAVAPHECLQVTVAGEGPDVVLIPGLFGSAFGFRRVIPLLTEAGYRSIVIEPLGIGHSSRPARADYSLTAQAERIRLALDALEVKTAIVVSHSMGVAMALRLSLSDPDRIRAVVALEGGPTESVATPGFRRAMKLAPLLKLLGAGRVIRGRVRKMLVSRSGNPAWVTDEIVARYSAGASRDLGATIDAFKQMAKAREPEPLGPRLRDIRCPVILVLGAAPHEGGPPESEVASLRGNVPRFTVTLVPGAGSFLPEEAPDAVLSAVEGARVVASVPRTAER
jgi:pimeloyl-ACP methyl ester carboxylesterase/sterol desaturase/sphingolipid hydroxylase (fatty acid hydroxylase superfamily)